MSRRHHGWTWSLCVLMALPICHTQAALNQDAVTRPQATSGAPTDVFVLMGLMDVDGVDSAEQSFVANLYLDIRWQDPALTHQGPGHVVLPLDAVWHPQLLLVNQQKIFSSLPEVVRVMPEGEVVYRQRVWGSFSQPLQVRNFPFDEQDFEIRVTAAEYTTREIRFLPHPVLASGLADTFSLPDWKILGWELDFGTYKPGDFTEGNASFALVFHGKRYSSHYVVKVIFPLILIVMMSMIVFWIDPEESGTQIGIATTSMLTLIAYRFMVGGMIPPVPYLTRIDYFVLGSTSLVFAALIQAVLTSIVSSRNKADLARKLDAWCRVIFGVLFALITWGSLVA